MACLPFSTRAATGDTGTDTQRWEERDSVRCDGVFGVSVCAWQKGVGDPSGDLGLKRGRERIGIGIL